MSAQCEVTARRAAGAPLGLFERWLSLWVALCIVVGVAAGQLFPAPFQALGRMAVAQVNLPVGLLIWVMIIPMLMKIDFSALHQVRAHWRGIGLTLFVNWAVKPFSMALLATLVLLFAFQGEAILAQARRESGDYYDFLIDKIGAAAREMAPLAEALERYAALPAFRHLQSYEALHLGNMSRVFAQLEAQ